MVAVAPQAGSHFEGTMYRLDDRHHPLPPPRSLKVIIDQPAVLCYN